MLGSVMRLELCWPRLCAKLLLLTFFLPGICINTIFRRTMPGDKSAGFTDFLHFNHGSQLMAQLAKETFLDESLMISQQLLSYQKTSYLVDVEIGSIYQVLLERLYLLQLRCHNISKCERVSARQLLVPVLDSP